MTGIKVSVLTPLYCHDKKYVRKCLESLQVQTLNEIEFILIDNGANEDNKTLINEFQNKDSRFKVIHILDNKGYGPAMNTGLKSALGEYIGIVESDDFIAPNMYEELYNKAKENDVDICKSGFIPYYSDNRKVVPFKFPQDKLNAILTKQEATVIPTGHVCQWSAIYRLSIIKDNECYYSENKQASLQDMTFCMQTWFSASSFYLMDKAFYYYRLNNANSSRYDDDKTAWGASREYKYLCSWMEKHQKILNDFDWEVFAKCEYIGKLHQLKNRMKHHKLCYICRAIYPSFKYLLKKKKIKFVLFSESEKKEFKKISRHPLIYGFQFYKSKNIHVDFHLKDILFRSKTNNNSTDYFLFGIHFSTVKKDLDEYRLKILGITGIHKKNGQIEHYIKFLGVPLYYKNLQSQLQIQQIQQIQNVQLKLDEVCNQLTKQKEINNRINQKVSNLKCIIEASILHKETFGPYKNAFKDKDVVLVCPGPTAKKYKPIKDAIHVGVNGAVYINNIKLDYLFVQDYTIFQKSNESLVQDAIDYKGNNCKKFLGIIPDECLKLSQTINIERIPYRYSLHEDVNQYVLEDIQMHNIAQDLSREPLGEFDGTTFSALQFILYANPKRLYLVGFDCGLGYAYDKPNAYGSASAKINIVKKYFVPFINMNYPNTEVVSINPVGLKGIFKDIYTED